MCCQKRRAAQYGYGGGYGGGCHYSGRSRQSGILTLIEGVQQMRLASQQRAMEDAAFPSTQAPMPNASLAGLDKQTQGTIFDMIHGNDEKRLMSREEAVNFEVLPTYEEAAEAETPQMAADVPQIASAKSAEPAYIPANVNQSLTSRGLILNDFNAALNSYRGGDCCGKGRARRAAKNLVRELASQEIARLQATHGPSARKQRKQVLRDLEPIKYALKSAVREVRRE